MCSKRTGITIFTKLRLANLLVARTVHIAVIKYECVTKSFGFQFFRQACSDSTCNTFCVLTYCQLKISNKIRFEFSFIGVIQRGFNESFTCVITVLTFNSNFLGRSLMTNFPWTIIFEVFFF